MTASTRQRARAGTAFLSLALISALSLVTACGKKTTVEPARDLLAEVCQTEVGRHGEIDYDSDFTHFGNAAMDDYVQSPGPPEALWRFFEQTDGVCRGALIQLMVEAHLAALGPRLRRSFDTLGEEEQAHLLSLIRVRELEALEEIVIAGLDESRPVAVRGAAAASLAVVDQDSYRDEIRAFAARETDADVLAQLALILDPAEKPWHDAITAALFDHPSASLHEAIMTGWATSDLEDKRSRIEAYAHHGDQTVREMATHLLTSLEGKDKLAWKMTTPPGVVEADADPEQLAAMQRAVAAGDRVRVRQLLAEGFAFTQQGGFLGTAVLFDVLMVSPPEMIPFLLEVGLDPDFRDESGLSPLMYLARHGYHGVATKLEALVAAGADIDATNQAGETALMQAVYNNRSAAIRTLLALGADPARRDGLGRTALTIARLLENEACIRALEAAERK